MAEATTVHEKLYYFSVFFGETTRVLNWHWDRDVALIWFVTQHVHQAIVTAIQAMRIPEQVVRLTPQYFDALTQATFALAAYIEHQGSDEELNQIMGRFAELTYITTGNGYYLYQKGQVSLG